MYNKYDKYIVGLNLDGLKKNLKHKIKNFRMCTTTFCNSKFDLNQN